jgi:hypothetical protein
MVTLMTTASVHKGTDHERQISRFSVLFLTAVIVATIFLIGCGGGVSATDVQPGSGSPPSDPPATGAATLTWAAPSTNVDGTPLTSLAGYKVYYGRTPGVYASIDVGSSSTYQVAGLTKGQTYYFAVTAYDANGNESDFSTIVTKVVG